MARTKQIARNTAGSKRIAKKSALASKTPATKTHTSKRKGSGHASLEDTDADSKIISNSSSSPVVNSVRAVRAPYYQAPNFGDYAMTIWFGAPGMFEKKTIHVGKLPARTLAILERGSQVGVVLGYPFRMYYVNAIPETFTIYHNFLYTGVLFSPHPESDQDFVDNGQTETHEDAEWSRLAQAYLLGLRLEDEKFCNSVIDGLVEKISEVERYPTGIATEVYSMTSLGDPLRSLIVDLHVCKGLGTWINPPHEDASGPEDFLHDVQDGMAAAAVLLQEDDVPMPWEYDICQYHKHEVTEKCERKHTVVASEWDFNESSLGLQAQRAQQQQQQPKRSPRNAGRAPKPEDVSKIARGKLKRVKRLKTA